MSGQPSGNPSGPRPTANGVGASGMASSQQRTDPQVGSSTSNGQSGSMSQSNLNSIVRQKISCLVLPASRLLGSIVCLPFVSSVSDCDGSLWVFGEDRHLSPSTGSYSARIFRHTSAVLGINTPCASRDSHAWTRFPYHALLIKQHRSF